MQHEQCPCLFIGCMEGFSLVLVTLLRNRVEQLKVRWIYFKRSLTSNRTAKCSFLKKTTNLDKANSDELKIRSDQMISKKSSLNQMWNRRRVCAASF